MSLCSVIKYDGNNETFIYKFPEEDFNTLSQLIVNESQEAIFFNNGKALDVFNAGRYTLSTQNIPIITDILKLATNGVSPFHCTVYYVNKIDQMAIKWGTDSKIQYIDPYYGFPLSIGLSGEMCIRINDGKKLTIKLVGTTNEFNRETLINIFRGFLMSKIKPYIAKYIKNNKINIFEIDEKIDDFSNDLKNSLKIDFDEYGLELVKFFVLNVVKPEDDPQYKTFKELHFRQFADLKEATIKQQVSNIEAQTKANRIVIESKAIAQKREQEGYTYQQERGFEVAGKIAENEAIGQYTNMGVGLGAMAGIGGTMAGIMGSAVKGVINNDNNTPPPLPYQNIYHVFLGENKIEKYDVNTIEQLIKNAIIKSDTLVWKKGMDNWTKLSMVQEFNQLFNKEVDTPPPLPNN